MANLFLNSRKCRRVISILILLNCVSDLSYSNNVLIIADTQRFSSYELLARYIDSRQERSNSYIVHPSISFYDLRLTIDSLSPKYVIIIGENEFKIDKNFATKINLDYQLAKNLDNTELKYIVCRLPFKTNKELKDYLVKFIDFSTTVKSLKNKIVTFDPYNYISKNNSFFSNTLLIKDSQTWNLFSKLRIHLGDDNNLDSIINNTEYSYIVYVGHGSENGWFSSNKLNHNSLKKINSGRFFYNFDVSCRTGNWSSKSECYAKKMLKLEKKGSISYIAPIERINEVDLNCIYNQFFNSLDDSKNIGEIFLAFQKSTLSHCNSNITYKYCLLGLPF